MNSAEQEPGRLVSELDYTDASTVVGRGVHEFIDELQDGVSKVGDAITATFFRHAPPSSLTEVS